METLCPEKSTPDAAKTILINLFNRTTDQDKRALLQRLAGIDCPQMKNVWENLPTSPPDLEGDLIQMAFNAPNQTFKHTLKQIPLPRIARESGIKGLEHRIELTQGVNDPSLPGDMAMALYQEMDASSQDARALWDAHWRGEDTITFDQALRIVGQIALTFFCVRDEINSTLPSPPIQWKSDSAKQAVVMDIVSKWFNEKYDTPHDSLVTSLVCVILDRDDINEETVKKRRQRNGTK